MNPRFFLILFLFYPLFALAKKCDGVRTLDSPTARFIALLELYRGKGILDAEELATLLGARKPINPFAEFRPELGPIRAHAYRSAFAAVLAEGGIAWGEVKSAVREMLGGAREEERRQNAARGATRGLVTLRARTFNSLHDLKIWEGPDGKTRYAYLDDESDASSYRHWHYVPPNGTKPILLGGDMLAITELYERPKESPLLVVIQGTSRATPEAIEILDGDTGAKIHTERFTGPAGWNFTPDGPQAFLFRTPEGRLAVFGAFYEASIGNRAHWTVLGGQDPHPLPHFTEPMQFARGPDGSSVYAYGVVQTPKGPEARVYDALSGKLLHAKPFKATEPAKRSTTQLYFSRRGEIYLAAGSEERVEVYNFTQGKRWTFPGAPEFHPAEPGFAEGPNGEIHYAYAQDGHAVMLDLAKSKRTRIAFDREPVLSTEQAFHRYEDGRLVLYATDHSSMWTFDFTRRTSDVAEQELGGNQLGVFRFPDGRAVTVRGGRRGPPEIVELYSP